MLTRIIHRHKILNEVSFINNLIINYSYNRCLDVFDLNYIFVSNIFLLYKIRMFRCIFSLFKFCKFNKNIKHITALHSRFFQRLSYNNFIYLLQNFVYLQICDVGILEKIFFELEFFYEKKNLKVFFCTLFSIWEIVFSDPSVIDHFLSYFKSCKDAKCDLNGYGQMYLTRIDLDYFFTSNIYEKFYIQQGKILTKRKNTPNYLFIFNRNSKRKFDLIAFKIKIKQNGFQCFFLNINYSRLKTTQCEKNNWFFFRNLHFFQKYIIYKYSYNLVIHKFKIFYWLLGFFEQEKLFNYFVFKFICNYNQINTQKYLKCLTHVNYICNLKMCVYFLSKYVNILKHKTNDFLSGIFFFNNIYIQKTRIIFLHPNYFAPIFVFSIFKNKFKTLRMFFFLKLIFFEEIFYNNLKSSINYMKIFKKNTFDKFRTHLQVAYNILKSFFFNNIPFSNKKKLDIPMTNNFIKKLINLKNTAIYFCIDTFFQTKLYGLKDIFLILSTNFTTTSKILVNNSTNFLIILRFFLKISNLNFSSFKKISKNLIFFLKLLKFFQKKIVFNYKIYDRENNLAEYTNAILNSFDIRKIFISDFTYIFFLTKKILNLYKIRYKKLIITKKSFFFCS